MIPIDDENSKKKLKEITSRMDTVGTIVSVIQFLAIILSVICLPMLWFGIMEPTNMVRAIMIFLALVITCGMSISAALYWIERKYKRSMWLVVAVLALIIVFIGSIFLKEILLKS